jgi:hypothetical protein
MSLKTSKSNARFPFFGRGNSHETIYPDAGFSGLARRSLGLFSREINDLFHVRILCLCHKALEFGDPSFRLSTL